MKKILIFLGSTDIGGTEKQLLNILNIIQSKFHITLVIFHKNGLLERSFKRLKVNLIDITKIGEGENKALKIINKFFGFYKILKNEKPDIVHFFLPQSYLIGGWLSYFFNCKFIMSRRSLNIYQKKYFFIRYFEVLLHKKMDLIIGNSKKVLENLSKDEFVPKSKLKLIYNGVENNYRKKNNVRNINLVCIANFLPYKNHSMLIKACHLIKSKKKWNLKLIGSGDKQYILEIEKLIKELGLNRNIKIIQNLCSVKKYLINSHIGVLTSNEEGFSNSILEYMSNGLCVVATKVGGNDEAIKDCESGYLVEKGDYKTFSERLNLVINNNRIRDRISKSGLKRSIKEFDMNKSASELSSIYNNILK